jgi:predicted lipoprotein with Yx(FWY)xxD motif
MRPTTRLFSLAGAGALLLVAAACSSAGSSPTAAVLGAQSTPTVAAPNALMVGVAANSNVGTYLTGQNGLTLYIFTADSPDKSACTTSQCLANWSPLTVASGATIAGPMGATGTWATISRSDGTLQVTYNHQPLYYFKGDAVAGDTNGQGFGNKWYVAPMNGTYSPGSSASASAAAGGYGY